MAGETNAAIDGAIRAGATDVLVRDSHGDKRNLLPADVDPRARLLRGSSAGPKNMMEGIDSAFAAVVFVGYHARYNALTAGFYGRRSGRSIPARRRCATGSSASRAPTCSRC